MSGDLLLISSESTTFSPILYTCLEEYLFKNTTIALLRKDEKQLILKDNLDWHLGIIQKMDEEQDLELQILRFLSENPKEENIIFENGLIAVLFQEKKEICQIKLSDKKNIHSLYRKFFAYQSAQKQAFESTIRTIQLLFSNLFVELQSIILPHLEKKSPHKEKLFQYYRQHFKSNAKTSDITPLVIQHILTADFWLTLNPSFQKTIPFQLIQPLYQEISLKSSHYQDFIDLEQHYAHLAQIIIQAQKQIFITSINQRMWGDAGIFKQPKSNLEENKIVSFVLKSTEALWQKHYQTPFLGSLSSILLLSEHPIPFFSIIPSFFPKFSQKKLPLKITVYEKNLLSYYQNQYLNPYILSNSTLPNSLQIHHIWADELLSNTSHSSPQTSLFADIVSEKVKKTPLFQLIYVDEKRLQTKIPSDFFEEISKNLNGEKHTGSKQALQTYVYFKWASEHLDKQGIVLMQLLPEVWHQFRTFEWWDTIELKFGNIYAIETSELVFLYCIK